MKLNRTAKFLLATVGGLLAVLTVIIIVNTDTTTLRGQLIYGDDEEIIIIDNHNDSGFTFEGKNYNYWSGYRDESMHLIGHPGMYNGNYNGVPTWSFSGLTPGEYEVLATWKNAVRFVKDADYVIEGNGEKNIIRINQGSAITEDSPTIEDAKWSGRWQDYQWAQIQDADNQTFSVGSDGNLTITLRHPQFGFHWIVADAVAVRKVSDRGGENCLTLVQDVTRTMNKYVDETIDCFHDGYNPLQDVTKDRFINNIDKTDIEKRINAGESCDDYLNDTTNRCDPVCVDMYQRIKQMMDYDISCGNTLYDMAYDTNNDRYVNEEDLSEVENRNNEGGSCDDFMNEKPDPCWYEACFTIYGGIMAIVNSPGSVSCGETGYDAKLDVDNNEVIGPPDLITLASANNEENETSCNKLLNNPIDPCGFCGDGTVQASNGVGQSEECDDYNQEDGDFCDRECTRGKLEDFRMAIDANGDYYITWTEFTETLYDVWKYNASECTYRGEHPFDTNGDRTIDQEEMNMFADAILQIQNLEYIEPIFELTFEEVMDGRLDPRELIFNEEKYKSLMDRWGTLLIGIGQGGAQYQEAFDLNQNGQNEFEDYQIFIGGMKDLWKMYTAYTSDVIEECSESCGDGDSYAPEEYYDGYNY